MPMAMRLPKLRGFHNFNRREFATVNLGKLNRFEQGTKVGPELLLATGVIRKPLGGLKILAAGELKVALTVSAHRFSAGARTAIEAAGGSVELLEPAPEPKPVKVREAKAAPVDDEATAAPATPTAEAPAAAAPAAEAPAAEAEAPEAPSAEPEPPTAEDSAPESTAPAGDDEAPSEDA
jgi:ribosomal protein L18E